MTSQYIPLVDLKADYLRHRAELDAAIAAVVDTTSFISGPDVEAFEREFAAYCGTAHAVGVGSGTAALHMSLLALEVGAGDEVVTVAHTFAATAEAVGYTGARVRFVDIDESGGMDPKALAGAVQGARVVVPVHLYGQPADMAEILRVSGEAGATVLEDAAQAHGAILRLGPDQPPRRAGSLGRIAAFSFYPAKNLGAFGDAGGVTTDDDALAARVAKLHDHGRSSKYEHEIEGWGERLDTLHAAVLRVKLRHLDEANRARQRLAARYGELLAGVGDLRLPADVPERPSVWHLYVVRSQRRDALLGHLRSDGIGAGVHYPVPLHLQPAWRRLGYAPGDLPVTEAFADECLSLPLYPLMSDEQQDRVAASVRRFFEM
ncbi:MAG TPA: DegT/DnrJ/EryC1/StrS family aminotransferase [Actinomycetes bacterium]|nr:DegT/DnrJ/EryC1/StrS family aminotransferase [Actinomycetes bacterium]